MAARLCIFGFVLCSFFIATESKTLRHNPRYILKRIGTGSGFFGPKYPITASWFKDRFSFAEWNRTLWEFSQQDGDTVWLRAPPMVRRTKQDLETDPYFAGCGSTHSNTGATGSRCYEEAEQELYALNLTVAAFVTYQYEENFGSDIAQCEKYDRVIVSNRIYYRIVLPTTANLSNPCDIPAGSSVVVLFTSFAGTDPHELLMQAAPLHKMSVYFGLPAAPRNYETSAMDEELLPAYYEWIRRVLQDHKHRYPSVGGKATKTTATDILKGYYSTDEIWIADPQLDKHIAFYQKLSKLTHDNGKRFVISPYILLNRYFSNASLDDHVQGYSRLAECNVADVIAVQEGRGAGRGAYYWPTEIDRPIREVDSVLFDIITYINPNTGQNTTFKEAFSASNQDLFSQIAKTQDDLRRRQLSKTEYWLNIEACEYLRDDPCLPIDTAGSGNDAILNRATKGRLDLSLTGAGVTPHKIVSFAWDSDFTCVTKKYKGSLAAEIRHDFGRPIIADCFFHSKDNRSVVIIGFNLLGETQSFMVDWPGTDNKRHVDDLHGYYFEADWGGEHNRVPSLIYTQLYDFDVSKLKSFGYVKVSAHPGYHSCIFVFDFR